MRTMITGTFDQIVDLSEGNTTLIRLEDPFIANLQLILFGSFAAVIGHVPYMVKRSFSLAQFLIR